MKLLNFRSRLGVGSVVLYVLVCGSVVWAGDTGARLRRTVTNQTKTYTGQAQLTLKSSNNTLIATSASNKHGEHSFVTNYRSNAGVKMRESK